MHGRIFCFARRQTEAQVFTGSIFTFDRIFKYQRILFLAIDRKAHRRVCAVIGRVAVVAVAENQVKSISAALGHFYRNFHAVAVFFDAADQTFFVTGGGVGALVSIGVAEELSVFKLIAHIRRTLRHVLAAAVIWSLPSSFPIGTDISNSFMTSLFEAFYVLASKSAIRDTGATSRPVLSP